MLHILHRCWFLYMSCVLRLCICSSIKKFLYWKLNRFSWTCLSKFVKQETQRASISSHVLEKLKVTVKWYPDFGQLPSSEFWCMPKLPYFFDQILIFSLLRLSYFCLIISFPSIFWSNYGIAVQSMQAYS